MKERNKETSFTPRSEEAVETKLLRIAEKAKGEPKCQFTSLFHLMNKENMEECFMRLRTEAATGIDKMTKEMYQKDYGGNLKRLLERLHKMAYIPQAVKRVYIPKPGSKKMRPLGIPTLEDKLVQAAMVRIMESIYEQDFINDSYGFRPGRNCHDALRELNRTVQNNPVNYIVEADIKGFFDNVDHECMMKFLRHRIADKRILRMVKRFLKADVMEDGELHKSETGTPQGGIISPLLANIYLHYTLDLWFERVFRENCTGYSRLIRYADDFVVCFQRKSDAQQFHKVLKERLAKFGLEVEPSKTKILSFGRFAVQNAAKASKKPETFDFLGFTHYCSRSRDGKRFRMKRKTSRKKYTAKLKVFKEWLKVSRTMPTAKLMKKVQLKLAGHYAYYGVTDNSKGIRRFAFEIEKLLYKWLNRRGKSGSFNWEKFRLLKMRYPLPVPRILGNLF